MMEFLINNPPVLVTLSLFWILIGCIIEGLIGNSINDDILITPKDFYDNTKMNWFGCWFCFALISIINPFGLAVKIIVLVGCCIFGFIDWLFTVGRKDD